MAKSPDTKSSKGSKGSKSGSKSGLGAATDKLAELAQNPLARSMLAAGLVTAAAALTANQKVRQSAKKASRDALDGAEAAADNASKVGTAILTAATDAVKRFMASATGGSDTESTGGSKGRSSRSASDGGKKAPAPKAGRKSAAKSNGKSSSGSTKSADAGAAAKPGRASSRAKSSSAKGSAAKPAGRRSRTKPAGSAGS
jgi:hypothetical protein